MTIKKSILINKEIIANLKKYKNRKNESYNNLITRMIDNYGGFIVD